MKQRKLTDDLQVSSIGYGTMGLSEFYGKTDDEQSFKVLRGLLDVGITMIDTADMYGGGHNERLIGKFLSSLDPSVRDTLTICTKCGIERPDASAYARRINNDPAYIQTACENSLKRLGVECIDLYYIHRRDTNTPLENVMEALSRLIKQGKIRHVGLSEVSAQTLRKAHEMCPITALQTEYSLWTRDIEKEILPVVKELGIALVPYSPLGRGFLTGRFKSNDSFDDNDFRKSNERFQDENIEHNLKLVEGIATIADKYSATTGQIALAWLLAQYERCIPIPGTKNLRYLRENAAAANIRLELEDLTWLQTLSQTAEVKGMRYSLEGMKGVGL